YGSGHFATDTKKEVYEQFNNSPSKGTRAGIDGNRSGEIVYATAVKLLDDKKTVFLKIHDMKTADNMQVRYNLKSISGESINGTFINSVFALSRDNTDVPDVLSLKELKFRVKMSHSPMGCNMSLTDSKGNKDFQYRRLLNLQNKKGMLPSSFVKHGEFTAIFKGSIVVLEKDEITFQTALKGALKFELDGKIVLEGKGQDIVLKSKKMALNSGAYAFTLTFTSSTAQDSLFKIMWNGKRFPLEPISPASMRRDQDGTTDKLLGRRKVRTMIAEKRCMACHKSDNKERIAEFNMDSPALSNAGGRLHQSWKAEWIANPRKFNKHANMPVLVKGKEAQHIAAYLAEDVQNDLVKEVAGDINNGANLFYDLGCISCHTRPSAKKQSGERLLLSNIAAKYKPQALKEYLKAPEKLYKWTKMPNFNLSDQEAADLASFLLVESANKPKKARQGNAALGKKLFAEKGCINCHGGSQLSLLAAKPFDKLKASSGCIARKPKGMVKYNLAGRSAKAISAMIKNYKTFLQQKSVHEFAERQFDSLNCNACHSRDNKDARWGGYLHEIKDLKTHYKHKGHLDQSRPQLTYVGEKIKQSSIKKYLDGSLPYNSREWLLARMPAFPARAKQMAASLALQHAVLGEKNHLSGDAEKIKIGKKLVGSSGFGCIVCHDVGSMKALAAFEVKGVNLQHSADRLNKDFYRRWMLNPVHVVPSTKMPKYADDQGKSPFADYGNDAEKQFEAIFEYINSLK
ncbi:MAG: c-type cytochrome, partial [Lentisphaeraceae bacterium]|nr:c-type cytochrome [Lentisphaeraceae bacterium]